jgi:hypothetical protein
MTQTKVVPCPDVLVEASCAGRTPVGFSPQTGWLMSVDISHKTMALSALEPHVAAFLDWNSTPEELILILHCLIVVVKIHLRQ